MNLKNDIMTNQEYEKAFAKLDKQFDFHLKIYRKEQLLQLLTDLKDKQLLKKQIENLEFMKRVAGL